MSSSFLPIFTGAQGTQTGMPSYNMFGGGYNNNVASYSGAMPGSNQYFGLGATASVPGNTGMGGAGPSVSTPVGSVPGTPTQGQPVSSAGGYPISYTPGMGYNQGTMTGIPVGTSIGLGKGSGSQTIPTMDPVFTSQFYSWLNSQLGQGATPYGGQVNLPGGGQTTPGQLTAPLATPEQQLLNFYTTGQGGPSGSQQLLSQAQGTGLGQQALAQQAAGINTTPEWQAMIAAMNGPQGPVAQQLANLKQQFAFAGDLSSSPMAQAMTQYGEQTALNQNALLGQLTMQGLGLQQSAAGTLGQQQAQAAQQLLGGAQQFGGALQSYDQSAIQNAYQEFLRTQPEYSPLLNMLYGGATSSPGVFSTTKGTGISSILGSAGGLLGLAGQTGGSIAEGLSGGGGFTDVLSSLGGMLAGL